MKYSGAHWKLFNFLTRRVMAVSFVIGGIASAASALPNILPGGTILVDGVPTDDLVIRWVSFILPLLLIPIGIFLFKSAPFAQKKRRK